jgi:hypothetical protein
LILKARNQDENDPQTIRFMNPASNEINFKAKDLLSLIDIEGCEIHEPSFTKEIATEEISNYAKMDNPPPKTFDFPCHTQGTERYIPLISNMTDRVSDSQREGYILATLKSRESNPCSFSKSNFNFL